MNHTPIDFIREIESQTDVYQKPISEEIKKMVIGIQTHTLNVINAKQVEEILDIIEKNISILSMINIPEEISILLQNPVVMEGLNNYIKAKIPYILNKDSMDSYYQFVVYFFLLGMGKYNKITDDFNEYDMDKLNATFDSYISLIVEDKDNSEVYLQCFLNLSELINKLCIMSEIDSLRTDCILQLKNLLQEKILKLLALCDANSIHNERFKELHYFLGRIHLNFSHIGFVSTKEKNVQQILQDYLEIAMRQREGYLISESAEFGGNPDKAFPTFQVCLGNLSFTMSLLVHKLTRHQNFDEKDILTNPIFQQILEIYESIHLSDRQIHSLQDLKNLAIEVFTAFYYHESFPKVEQVSPVELVSDFIALGGPAGDYFQLETIHHLILFCDDFSTSDLIQLGYSLLSGQKFSHYNFEFMKLKIVDVIINKFPLGSITPEIEGFLLKVVEYIESNKVASQLLYTYARLYFSISYFYSLCDSEKFQKLSLDYFALFSRMAINFDYEKYGKDLDDYAYNIGTYGLSKDYCQEKCFPNCALTGQGCNKKNVSGEVVEKSCELEKDKVIAFGHRTIEKHSEGYDQNAREDLEEVLSRFLENALKSQQIDDGELHEHLSDMLSKKFFHGIAEIHIRNSQQITDSGFSEYRKNNILVRQITMNLIDDYKLFCIYPKNYTPLFQKILNKDTGGRGYYVLLHIKNIIDLYLTRRKSYIDPETQLPNQSKLSELFMRLTQGKKKTSFIKIRLDILEVIQGGYGEDTAREYIKQVAHKLSQITRLKGKVYKLEFADFGVVIDNHKLITQTLESIQGISINLEGLPLSFNPMIGVVVDESNFWLDKSSMALVAAKQKKQKQGFYDHDNIREAMQILKYATKLKEAIAEDRVVPFFQPIYDARTHKVCKYEALMRIKKPDGTFDGPYMYLLADGLLEETHIVEIMIQKTFEYASTHPGSYSINLSGDDLTRKDLHGIIKENLQKYNIEPARITFEILEGVWNQNKTHPIMLLKLAGFEIAMDDFGAENSNFDRFLELLEHKQIDYLKIDGKVVKKLIGSELSNMAIEMLRGIVSSAHMAGVKVVAEFIDSYELSVVCTTLGVDLLQGYYFSPPIENIDNIPKQHVGNNH